MGCRDILRLIAIEAIHQSREGDRAVESGQPLLSRLRSFVSDLFCDGQYNTFDSKIILKGDLHGLTRPDQKFGGKKQQ